MRRADRQTEMSTVASREVQAIEIRVRGRVQGVGFRPAVWRIASELGLAGEVLNDGGGALLRVSVDQAAIAALFERIERGLPPLARIEGFESKRFHGALPAEFRIAESAGGAANTEITPDAAICAECAAEMRRVAERRYRYSPTARIAARG